MNVLVTGGAGFIGTNLIFKLLQDSHKVVSLDNYSTGKRENEVKNQWYKGCVYYDVDITKTKDYSFFMDKVDVIFHLAALARIQPSLIDPVSTIENNFNGTLNILEYARQNSIRVVYAGSSSFHHGLYSSPYAWSKYGGEELCKLYGEVYGLSTAICRFYNVYGKHQVEDGPYSTVIGIFERQYRNGEPLTITGNGEQRRDFTHVDDIVNGLTLCMNDKFNADIFELGSGVNYSMNELADMFGGEKKYIPARKGEYDRTLCDYSKTELKLGYKPTRNIKEYIKGII
ncbi:NAD-dependent epimerase/dehydratase family protein [Candidatus Woesearchaeota archaeon]|nr:NAD-dependent epimerase/dehydratase family protein [Candidatus Woesearchaeota archaeon]